MSSKVRDDPVGLDRKRCKPGTQITWAAGSPLVATKTPLLWAVESNSRAQFFEKSLNTWDIPA
jgi:hypothetical protein